jgi:hypothetical protein
MSRDCAEEYDGIQHQHVLTQYPQSLLSKISRSWTSSPEFMGLRGL